jgi:hypothetical protein
MSGYVLDALEEHTAEQTEQGQAELADVEQEQLDEAIRACSSPVESSVQKA